MPCVTYASQPLSLCLHAGLAPARRRYGVCTGRETRTPMLPISLSTAYKAGDIFPHVKLRTAKPPIGIEPMPPAYQAGVLPLNDRGAINFLDRCIDVITRCVNIPPNQPLRCNLAQWLRHTCRWLITVRAYLTSYGIPVDIVLVFRLHVRLPGQAKRESESTRATITFSLVKAIATRLRCVCHQDTSIM